MARARIILADDHALIRQGIRKIIEESSEFEVIGEAGDGKELLEIVESLRPDIVVTDITMPGMRGIEATSAIKEQFPGIRVLILSMHKSREYLFHAMGAGADGYVLKDDSDRELLLALHRVLDGQVYTSEFFHDELYQDTINAFRDRQQTPRHTLSEREKEVLTLVAEGKTSKEIAFDLSISMRTVDHHRANIMRKMDFQSTADLIKYAIHNGYIT